MLYGGVLQFRAPGWVGHPPQTHSAPTLLSEIRSYVLHLLGRQGGEVDTSATVTPTPMKQPLAKGTTNIFQVP